MVTRKQREKAHSDNRGGREITTQRERDRKRERQTRQTVRQTDAHATATIIHTQQIGRDTRASTPTPIQR